MAGNTYFVGTDAALAELLQRTDAISEHLTIIDSRLETLAMTFEEYVQLLINYAKALKTQLEAMQSGATDALIEGLQAEVEATKARLNEALAEIAADTAQEESLGAQIAELLAPSVAEEPEPPADEQPAEQEPPFVEEDPIVTPDPEPVPELLPPPVLPVAEDDLVEPGESDMFVPPIDTSGDMVA